MHKHEQCRHVTSVDTENMAATEMQQLPKVSGFLTFMADLQMEKANKVRPEKTFSLLLEGLSLRVETWQGRTDGETKHFLTVRTQQWKST